MTHWVILVGLLLESVAFPADEGKTGFFPRWACHWIHQVVGIEPRKISEDELFKRRALLPDETTRDRALKIVERELERENRWFSDLPLSEQQELADFALAEVHAIREREAQEMERQVRLATITEEIYGESFGWREISKLSTARIREILMEALARDSSLNFQNMKPSERTRSVEKIVEEISRSAEAIKAETIRRGIPFDSTYPKILELALKEMQRGESAQEAVNEVVLRQGPMEKGLDEGIAGTGPPWNWQLRLQKNAMRELVLEALSRDLVAQGKRFSRMTRAERDACVRAIVDTAFTPYRSRPNLTAIGVGLGMPIVLAYAGGTIMPEGARPAWYILSGILGFPFTFGVSYWINVKLKPYFALNVRSSSRIFPDNPMTRDMTVVGTNSTSIPDNFKDGRNINKDGQLNPRDSMNDAAWRIIDEEDARATLAGALLYYAHSFPETKIESLLSFLLYMKLKDRFGDPESFRRVSEHIDRIAKEAEISPVDAHARLERILRPELWKWHTPSSQVFSAQADRELRQILKAFHEEEVTVEQAAEQLAWGALFYEVHYANAKLSQATTFELYMRLKARLSLSQVRDEALATIAQEAPGLNVSPAKAESRLAQLLRADLWE